jgi:hypothetical protein
VGREGTLGPPKEAPWTPCLPGANPQTEPTGPARRNNPGQGRWLGKIGKGVGFGGEEVVRSADGRRVCQSVPLEVVEVQPPFAQLLKHSYLLACVREPFHDLVRQRLRLPPPAIPDLSGPPSLIESPCPLIDRHRNPRTSGGPSRFRPS